MNFFKLAERSVLRKPVKSILLLLIVFVISTLLLSGMSCRNASVEVQDKTRQAIGAGFLLEKNDEYRAKRINELSEKLGEKEGELDGYYQKKIVVNGSINWNTGTTNSFETLNLKDIEKISETEGISDYNITTAITAVNPVNFRRIEDKDTDQSADEGGVSLIGNRDMKMDTNVLSGNLRIKEGRMVQPDDTDVCVISQELAQADNLKIGDKLSFNDYHDKENSPAAEAEIIGIYQVSQKMSPLMQGDTYRSENVIFTDLYFPQKAEGETSPLFQRAYFKVGNVNDYDTVKERIKEADIDWQQYDLIDNNGNSETMSSNFNDLDKISETMIAVISAVGFFILIFVFLFWIKNRVHEIGVFLSLGISRPAIIGQIWTEAVMTAFLSVLLSFAIAPAVSRTAADYLVARQVQQAEEKAENDSGKVATEYTAPQQNVQKVNVTITPAMYLADGAGVLLLITSSVMISGISVLKRNPKDILSEMS